MNALKMRTLAAGFLVAAIWSCGRREADLGGGWYLRETTSGIPEAGGYHRHLLRGSFLSRQVVSKNIADYRRYGRECIVYQPITAEIQFLAACGSDGPRVIAVGEREGDWLLGQDGLEQVLAIEKGEGGVVSTVAVIREEAIRRFLATAGSKRVEAKRKVGSGEVVADLEVAVLRKPLDSRELDAQDENGLTRLARACRDHDASAVSVLLSRGANPNIRDRNGNTPIIFAADRPEILEVLVSAGADVNAESKSGNFPLKEAVSAIHCAGRIEACVVSVKVLLSAGADPAHRNRFGDLADAYTSDEELRAILRDARLQKERSAGSGGKGASSGASARGRTPSAPRATRRVLGVSLNLLTYRGDRRRGDST